MNNENMNNEDLVLTPGGRRPKSSVHEVRPNEVVRVGKDGTYEIISDRLQKEKKKTVDK